MPSEVPSVFWSHHSNSLFPKSIWFFTSLMISNFHHSFSLHHNIEIHAVNNNDHNNTLYWIYLAYPTSESITMDISRLPSELQTIIWRFVLRDDRPGVHVFGYSNVNNNGNSDNGLSTSISTGMSTYSIDRALWTLCLESRFVVSRHFVEQASRRHPLLFLEPPVQGPLAYNPNQLTYPSIYFSDNGPRRFVTGAPSRDLFIFHMEQFRDSTRGPITPQPLQGAIPRTVEHVGIEFNPAWYDEESDTARFMEDENFRNMWRMIRGQEVYVNLWIIDTSLKRKNDAPPLGDDLFQFYARDKKFPQVVVDFGDQVPTGELLEDWDYIQPAGRNRPSSMAFVRALWGHRWIFD
ncbi:hypothetical protein NW768_011250 [Fusarium equiseti]|uniref:Uncharacterized protein n=1 Tax=Fusarium equiseti TaxID=61235 RepID=A0ABQ8QY91_FUSEQ|nr:hypothetical protein NW768_011250 [Fusarium equiseti]